MKFSAKKKWLVSLTALGLVCSGMGMSSCTNPFEHLTGVSGNDSPSDEKDSTNRVSDDGKTDKVSTTNSRYPESTDVKKNPVDYHLNGLVYELDTELHVAYLIGIEENWDSVFIPDSLEYEGETYPLIQINDRAFACDVNLRRLQINGGVTIGANAFLGCTSLVEVYISSQDLTIINSRAFEGCSKLTRLVLDCPNLSSIGDGAFNDCVRLSLIQNNTPLPLSRDSGNYGNIGLHALTFHCDTDGSYSNTSVYSEYIYSYSDDYNYFCGYYGCDSSYSMDPNVNVILPYAFYQNADLIDLLFNGNNLRIVGDYSFSNCVSLDSAKIPEGTLYLGKSSFDGCSMLSGVTLPRSIQNIGDYAFRDCASLTTIDYLGTTQDWAKVQLGSQWYGNINVVQCTDGTVNL